jgi:hypothetical protein
MERRINGSAPITPDDYASLNLFTVRGAVGDVAPAATAYAHRQALLQVQVFGFVNTSPPHGFGRRSSGWTRRTSSGAADGACSSAHDSWIIGCLWPTFLSGFFRVRPADVRYMKAERFLTCAAVPRNCMLTAPIFP